MTRKYILVKSQHRPDGLATIWVTADREFTPKEAMSKAVDVATANLDKCKYVFAGYNERFVELEKLNGVVKIGKNPRELEILVSPDCISHVVDYMKTKWKGRWTTKKAWKK